MTLNLNIDDEWSAFINNDNDNDNDNDSVNSDTYNEYNLQDEFNENIDVLNSTNNQSIDVPNTSDINISTKTKIAYLNHKVDLNIFWDIPVISYATASDGVIKKQIKINSSTPEELELVQTKLNKELYFTQNIITHIDNPNGRIKFKDTRKISIGISKKDIMSYRSKKKQAFYNCFVMILRIKMEDIFKEFHIKVFNTGKLEIPGLQSDEMFLTVLKHIVHILQPFYSNKLLYDVNSVVTVLINSNFRCGFYVNREILYDILRNKYNIQAIYDPCSYPGIQCKFQLSKITDSNINEIKEDDTNNKYKNKKEVSFMIFRTGSVLIVGMCDENVLQYIYNYLKNILTSEFKYICQKIISPLELQQKNKKKKIRRKTIQILTDIPEIETNINSITTENINKDIKEPRRKKSVRKHKLIIE